MPGFNQQQLQARARNANSVTIMVGAVIIGFGQQVSSNIDFGTEGLYGIGSALPQEQQQLKIAPEITIEQFALTANGLQVLGQPTTWAQILANNQFNITVVDGITKQSLMTFVGCVARTFSESIPANQVMTDSLTFNAMDVLGTSGQSILNVGNNAFTIPSIVGQISTNGLGLGPTS